MRFALPALPGGAVITGAFLRFRSGALLGDPTGDLDKIRFVRIDAGASLSSADYFSAELANDPASDFLVSAEIVANRDQRLIELFVFVALVYFALCFAGSRLVRRLQRRVAA